MDPRRIGCIKKDAAGRTTSSWWSTTLKVIATIRRCIHSAAARRRAGEKEPLRRISREPQVSGSVHGRQTAAAGGRDTLAIPALQIRNLRAWYAASHARATRRGFLRAARRIVAAGGRSAGRTSAAHHVTEHRADQDQRQKRRHAAPHRAPGRGLAGEEPQHLLQPVVRGEPAPMLKIEHAGVPIDEITPCSPTWPNARTARARLSGGERRCGRGAHPAHGHGCCCSTADLGGWPRDRAGPGAHDRHAARRATCRVGPWWNRTSASPRRCDRASSCGARRIARWVGAADSKPGWVLNQLLERLAAPVSMFPFLTLEGQRCKRHSRPW